MSKIKRLTSSALMVLTGCLTVILSPINVQAIDTSFFGSNDIIYYDPDVCSPDDTAASPSDAATSGGDGIYSITIKNPQNKQYHGDDYSPRNSALPVGDDGYSKQNSITGGIKYAHDKGYKSIDLDLNKSKDGLYFAAHRGDSIGKTWAKLDSYNATRKFKLSQLPDLLNAAKQYDIQTNIELKIWGKNKDVWSEADIIAIANMANTAGAEATLKGDGNKKNISDMLRIAQKHGFWVRTVLQTGKGNGWVPRKWYAPTVTSSSTQPSANTTSAPNGRIVMGQANIKVSASASVFKTQLDKIIARKPDFVSGNEWSSRSNSQIQRTGYNFYRASNNGDPNRHTDGVVVMWNTSRWTKEATGTVEMTLPRDKNYTSPNKAAQNWDGKRSMAWVTLKDAGGNKVSVASLHHMVNPNKYNPKDVRKELYKKGMERAAEKLKQLELVGPVLVAGDFNAQKADNGPWHPREVLGSIGMESTHDSLEKIPAYVDYIFYTKKDIKPIKHSVPFNLFDHPYVEATLQFTGNATYSGSVETNKNCSCQANAANATTALLPGSDNEKKAWNFLTGKGLSPEQAAGIMGNIQIESHFNPKISAETASYVGISQWDRSGRWARFVSWANNQGFDKWSFDAQMQYTYKEGDDRGNIRGIKAYNDVAHTAWYWGRFFEVAIVNGSTSTAPLTNVQMLSERTEAARAFLAKYGGTTGTPVGDLASSTQSNSVSCPDQSNDATLANAICSNVNQKPPEDYTQTTFPGTSEKTDKRTLYMVQLANDCLKQIGEKPITVVQGSYCGSGCASASGKSHDGGATIDIRTRDRGGNTKIMKLLKVLREVGFAAWYRDGGDSPSFAGNEHIHAVALGAPEAGKGAPGSFDQLKLYCWGGDGLRGGQKDRQLSIVGRPLPEWALHINPECKRYP